MSVSEDDMIDLSTVRSILTEVIGLVNELDRQEHDDSKAITSQSKSVSRTERAQRSQDLNLLADRLTLAAQLVKVEYWFARGHTDPLDIDRHES